MGLAVVIALAAATPAAQVGSASDFRLLPIRTAHRVVMPALPRPLLTVHEGGDAWRTRLVAIDPDAGRSGTPNRRQRIAAGLSFRMVNDGGTLASNIGMSGAVGRALDRIASEAVAAVAGDD